jgi:hypothetical protein
MLSSSGRQVTFAHSRKPSAVSSRLFVTLALCAAASVSGGNASAQTAQTVPEPSSLCGRENALEIVRQQVEAAKTFEDAAQRIAVMIRAADLLWPYQPENARATFAEAFDLAEKDFKLKGDERKKSGRGLLVETPDQRYVVVRAVAKRDPAWARRLTEEMLNKDRQESASASATGSQSDVKTAWTLLDTAAPLLPSDQAAANAFASASLKYPASFRLTPFLYKLAEVNQKEADRFYRRALAAYGDAPAREFLYLAAYPFGWGDAGDMPWGGAYNVPASFAPDVALKRLFVQALLRRAQQALQTPSDEADNFNGLPGNGHILQVLARLDPQVRRTTPDLAGAAEQTRNNLLSSLSQENRDRVLKPQSDEDSPPSRTFDEQLEAASNETDANRRDESLVSLTLGAGLKESPERVVKAADKVSDPAQRAQLLDWVYFTRAQAAAKDGQLDEATRLASKVQALDQRAYLYSEVAGQLLRKQETQNQARALLDELVATANKGPDTVVTARALLSAGYLYLNADAARAAEVFADAVKCVNRIKSPDFSRQSQVRRLEGKGFARYAIFRTPGFDPETAFRELAKADFDGALSLASNLADKPLRAVTTLALADYCLRRAAEQEKPEKAGKRNTP